MGDSVRPGIAKRALASEENVPMVIAEEKDTYRCIGLANDHYNISDKVWIFAHLTMQELTASLWQSSTPCTECLSIRYRSHSNSNLFKMVVRILCGLLIENADVVQTKRADT